MNEKITNYLKQIDEVIAKGYFKDNWESLSKYQIPQWYKDSKFGIFIHWGVYSVPAFHNEWYPRNMYLEGHHVHKHHTEVYGPTKTFGYKDFIPMFKAENFDAKEWADLFKKSGAKYIMPVAEHHDGFAMYHSELSEWCASKMGPCKDTLGLLKEAIEGNDMVFCTSSHRAEHYWFLDGNKTYDSGVPMDPEYGDLYWPNRFGPHATTEGSHNVTNMPPEQDFLEDWLVRTCELIDKYNPKVIYFDWWIHNIGFKPYLQKFAAYYYNRAIERGTEVAINYKYDAFKFNTAVFDVERGQMDGIRPQLWQTDTSVAKNSWSYTEENTYKKPNEIISDLVDIVSKNGVLLLNIGPKADGSIPQEDRYILEEIGKWLNINGEAIYDTTHWKVFGEGPTKVVEGAFTDTKRESFSNEDIRFTYKSGALYAFALKMPEDGVLRIKTLKFKSDQFNTVVNNVEVLGFDEKPEFVQWKDALTIKTKNVKSEYPVCFKISYE